MIWAEYMNTPKLRNKPFWPPDGAVKSSTQPKELDHTNQLPFWTTLTFHHILDPQTFF